MIYITERIYNDGPTKNFKLLGVLIDKYLFFEDHIDNLCTKISKLLFCIKRIKNFINQDSMKTLYYAMIHSHLVSCINIYSCTTDTFLNKLKLTKGVYKNHLQCRIQRPHSSVVCATKIFPLSQLIKYSTLTVMHSFAHKMLPFSFCQMWTTTNRDHNPGHGFRKADYIPQHIYASIKKYSFVQFP